MLALSYDLELALRSGAVLTSIACGVIWLCAWRSSHWDVRETELWSMLTAERMHLTRGPDSGRIQAQAAQVLHERLIWHGERIAVVAMVLWLCTGATMLVRLLLAG
jgi:hypothetical protein